MQSIRTIFRPSPCEEDICIERIRRIKTFIKLEPERKKRRAKHKLRMKTSLVCVLQETLNVTCDVTVGKVKEKIKGCKEKRNGDWFCDVIFN
jgi:hypothetical protein